METAQDKIVTRLMRLDSCAVSDALDKLGLHGCVTGLPPLSSMRKIAGRVHTVRLVAKDEGPPMSGPLRHLGTTAIEACKPGEIIVVEQKSGIDAGSWGGILSLGAKKRSVAGVIADGPVRDVDEARQMDFPVFGRTATARTARNRIVEVGTDIPVTIGEVTVLPGDYVLADASAVVFLAGCRIDPLPAVDSYAAGSSQQFRRDLRAGRFNMEFSQSARAALECINDAGDASIILILSDINMPGMSGLELLPKAKALRPDVPVIMITAYGDAETKRKALEGGAEALFTKPIDFASLRSEIDTRVERAA